jgi:virginiamycin B lyase
MRRMKRSAAAIGAVALLAVAFSGCKKSGPTPVAEEKPARMPPGVPELQVPFALLKPQATWKIGTTADWVVITPEAVWVASSKPDSVQRIDPKTNQVVASARLPAEACSGLEVAFGSVWVPVCTSPPSMLRVDTKTNQVSATLAIGPAGAEGGIAASSDSIWLVTDKAGTLSRIDPATNAVRQKVQIAGGSFNPVYSDGTVWISGLDGNVLTAVDAATGAVQATVAVGPEPRFLVADAGSVWTLNQGDGTLSRVDARTRKLVATIHAGLSGEGGDICYGGGSVWVTLFGLPLTRIDPASDKVVRQWKGTGGDSMRVGHDSIWLTDYFGGTLARYPLSEALKP